jgi:hypothetical protein
MSTQICSDPHKSIASIGPGRFQFSRPASAGEVIALVKTHEIEIVDLPLLQRLGA